MEDVAKLLWLAAVILLAVICVTGAVAFVVHCAARVWYSEKWNQIKRQMPNLKEMEQHELEEQGAATRQGKDRR